MAFSTRFSTALLASILLCFSAQNLSAQQQKTPTPPAAWSAPDSRFIEEAYSLELATFPSRVLAASVAQSVESLGWRPVRILKRGSQFGVYLGYTKTPGRIEYYRLELAAQEVAQSNVVTLDAQEIQQFEQTIEGPLTSPFTDSLGFNRSWFRGTTVINNFQETIQGLPITNTAELEQQLAVFLNRENIETVRGVAAADLLDALYDFKLLPEESFFLARQIASGELPVPGERRLKAMEVCAELYMGHFQDWRRAWETTRLLLNDPNRDAEGKIRDEMRRLALEVQLMTQPNQHLTANFPRIRSELRSIFDRVPISNGKLAAKVELFFLKTYSWEGNWDRVNELAAQYIKRNQQYPGEFVEAKFLFARSLERSQQYARALEEIRDITNYFPTQREAIYSGYKTSNIQERQLRWLEYFEKKKLDQESKVVGLIPAPKPTEIAINPEATK